MIYQSKGVSKDFFTFIVRLIYYWTEPRQHDIHWLNITFR